MAQRTPGSSVLVNPKPEQTVRKVLRSSMEISLEIFRWLDIIAEDGKIQESRGKIRGNAECSFPADLRARDTRASRPDARVLPAATHALRRRCRPDGHPGAALQSLPGTGLFYLPRRRAGRIFRPDVLLQPGISRTLRIARR